MKKKVRFFIIGAAIFIVLLFVAAINFFFVYAIDGRFIFPFFGVNYREPNEIWMAANFRDMSVTSFDGLKLHGFFIEADEPSDVYVITMHGYKAFAFHMASYAKHYYDRGWNVLVPQERAHGESEGKYIGMGYFENRDVVEWAKMIVAENSNAKIILHGVSMGAATVMMATANPDLPKNVVAAVEDCGYSTLDEEFSCQLKSQFKLPRFPIIPLSSLVAKKRAGYSWKDVSPLNAVSNSDIPTFFVHGDADTFVPFYMLDKLYEAASCEKQKLVVSGAKHTQSIEVAPDLYWGAIDPFLDKYLK